MPLEPPAPNPTPPDPPRPQRDPGGGTPPPSPNPTPGGRGEQARLDELAQEIARAVAAGDEQLADAFRQALREQEQFLTGREGGGVHAPAAESSFLQAPEVAARDAARFAAKMQAEARTTPADLARTQARAEQEMARQAREAADAALRRERVNDLVYRGGQPLYQEAAAPAVPEGAPAPARPSESLEGRALWRAGLERQAEGRARAGMGRMAEEAAAQKRAAEYGAWRHQQDVNKAAAALEPVPFAQPLSPGEQAARDSLGAAAAEVHRRKMAAAHTEAVVTGASEAAERGRQKAEDDMAESGRRAAAALSALPRVAAGVAGSFYTLERTVREGNPVVAGTFEQSARLLQGRIGRDLAPVVEDVTRGVRGAADIYADIPRGVREWGMGTFQRTFNPLVQLAGVGKMFGLGTGKPELSFEGLPRPRTTTFADYAAGLSAAGLQLGPLDQRVQQEKVAAMLETIGGETGKVADNTANTKNFFPTFGR
jgi:hypothetical protein